MNISEKIQMLKESGWSHKRLQNEYDKGLSFTALEKEIYSQTGVSIDRKTLKKIWIDEGLKLRSKEEDLAIRSQKAKEAKRLRTGFSTEDIIALYDSGNSLQKISSITKLAPITIRKILSENNIEIRRQVPTQKIIKDLESNGLSKLDLFDFYLSRNNSFNKTIQFLQEKTDFKIYPKTLRKILVHYEIVKENETLKEAQSRVSKRMFERNLSKIEHTEFESLQEIADFYVENEHLTKRSLVKHLNSQLPEDVEPITQRWIDRHVHPLLPPERRYGVSRVEREMAFFVQEVLPGEEMVTNCRSLISPYEVDVFLPNLKLAIEFNGDYWHSDEFMIPNHNMTAHEYHLMKFEACAVKGVKLAFVRECDWVNCNSEVKTALVEFIKTGAPQPFLSLERSLEDLDDE